MHFDETEKGAAKVQFSSAKRNHTRLANQMLNSCGNDKVDVEYMEHLFERLESYKSKLEQAFDTHLEKDSIEDEGQIDHNMELNEKAIQYFDFRKSKNISGSRNAQRKSAETLCETPRPRVVLPEMKPFSGRIRDYPNFKATFRNKYEVHYGDLASVVLKDKLLEGLQAQSCRALESVDEIFDILDRTFGDHGKLAETVLLDIDNLQPCHKNNLRELKFLVQTIRIADRDLEAVQLQHHIRQYHTVSVINEKLPSNIRKRWAAEIVAKDICTDDRYNGILNFLDREIRTLELSGLAYDEPLTDPIKHARHAKEQMPRNQDRQWPPTEPGSKTPGITGPRGNAEVSCSLHNGTTTHSLSQCRAFKYLAVDEQVMFLQENRKICRSCLEEHDGKCPREIWPCRKENCGKRHFHFVHNACAILSSSDARPHAYSAVTRKPASADMHVNSLSPGQCIRVTNLDGEIGILNTLWDNGSNVTLVLKGACDHFGFDRITEEVTKLQIEIVGGTIKEVECHLYAIPLYDLKNKIATTIHAYSVDVIGSKLVPVDLSEGFSVFGIPPWEQGDMMYPEGEIELLLGTDNAHLVLCHVSEFNGLRLSESVLGRIIWGRHPSFSSTPPHSRAIVVRHEKYEGKADRILSFTEDMVPSLFSTEIMGVQCTPNCGACACGKCSVDGDRMTSQERFEYQQIMDSITLENGIITVSFPLRKDLTSLPDNYELALKRLIQTEHQLKNDRDAARVYREQIEDMMQRQVLRKLTDEEITEWTGAVQYLPHHMVYKPSSSSTPARLVFDPSSPYKSKAVNDYWGRGPCLLNDQLGILYRFRESVSAIAGDISKMYNTVHTRAQEWHLHRVLMRDLDSRKSPEIYAIVRNSFGSGPAGTVAIAAKDYLAQKNKEEYPHAADTITNQTFVDDILDSTPSQEESVKLTKDIDIVLGQGSFRIKKWIIVESPKQDEIISASLPTQSPEDEPASTGLIDQVQDTVSEVHIGKSEESVLGIAWDTVTDEFYFKTSLNCSKRKKRIRQGPDLEPSQIFDKSIVPVLTRRMIMSQVHGLYDIMGLITPFVVELKFALGKLWRIQDPVDWDKPIPEDHDAHWRKLFDIFFELRSLRFSRCLSPFKPRGQPILVMFSDSSMIAFAAVGYIWFECEDNTYFTRLISAKNRMWPIKPDDWISIERGELQGAVLSKRLSCSIQREVRLKFREVIYAIDSEIVFSQINTDSHMFNVFVGHRVAEIRSATEINQWWIVKTEDNQSADLASRGTVEVSSLDSNSVWQNGPAWLQQPREAWPLRQTVQKKPVPLPELRCQDLGRRVLSVRATPEPCTQKVTEQYRVYASIQDLGNAGTTDPTEDATREFTKEQEDFIASRFDLARHDELNLWLIVTYRILQALSFPDIDLLRKLCRPIVVLPEQLQVATIFWLRQAQRSLAPEVKSGKYKTLTPFTDEDGVIRVNGRFLRQPGSYQPVLLPHYHPVSRLIVIYVHRRGHGGAVATGARVRAHYHILQLRQLCRQVRNDCMLCRTREHRLLKVPMASLPPERIRPSYPFEHTACDIAGPFKVHLPVKTTRNRTPNPGYTKAYVLILNCLSTRAIHLEVMHGMDTDAFLLAFRRFVCIRGQPKSCWSDNGGQIIAADRELQELVDSWDDERILKYSAENGTKWEYTSPGSPWQNGVSESLIRSVKATFRKITHSCRDFPIMELQTIFYEIAEILNERPLGLGNQGASGSDFDSETSTYLCPNQLLLGRCTVSIPAGPFESVPLSSKNRLLANQMVVTNWWNEWSTHYLPQLISQKKWYKSDRLVQKGDIVHIKDLNPIRGNWGIGEVVEVKDNAEHVPRNVLLRYKQTGTYSGRNSKNQQSRTQWRDVKNLVMIVPVEERGA